MSEIKTSYSLEEALSLTGFGFSNVLLFIYGALGAIGYVAETTGVSFISPASKCDLNLTPYQESIANSASLIGVAVGTYLWGYLGDVFGRKKMLIVSGFPSVLLTFSSVFFNFYGLIITRILAGFCAASIVANLIPYLGELTPVKYRSLSVATIGCSLAFCYSYMPLLAWLILPYDWSFSMGFLGVDFTPWRLLTIAYAAPKLIFVIGIIYYPESFNFTLNVDPEVTLQTLRSMYRKNNSKSNKEYPVRKIEQENFIGKDSGHSKLKQMWIQLTAILVPPYSKKTVLLCVLQSGSYLGCFGLITFFPEILYTISNYESTNSQTMCELWYQSQNINSSVSSNVSDLCFKPDNEFYIHSTIISIPAIVLTALSLFFLNKIGIKEAIVSVFFFTGTCTIAVTFVLDKWLRLVLLSMYQIITLNLCLVSFFAIYMFPSQYRSSITAFMATVARLGPILTALYNTEMLNNYCNLYFYIYGATYIICGFAGLLLPNIKEKKERNSKLHQAFSKMKSSITLKSTGKINIQNGQRRNFQNDKI